MYGHSADCASIKLLAIAGRGAAGRKAARYRPGAKRRPFSPAGWRPANGLLVRAAAGRAPSVWRRRRQANLCVLADLVDLAPPRRWPLGRPDRRSPAWATRDAPTPCSRGPSARQLARGVLYFGCNVRWNAGAGKGGRRIALLL